MTRVVGVVAEGQIMHGARYAYVYYGCRCTACTTANTDYQREATRRRAQRPASEVPHGTDGGYKNWCCRCPECTKAHSDKCREYARSRR